jgi:uncharacterized protein YeaO (DUF488 family)
MTKIQTFQIHTSRKLGEGLRIGIVRYLPRGVKKKDYARFDYFDVWFPLLSPSRKLLNWLGDDPDDDKWDKFVEKYKREMLSNTNSRQAIQLLAKLAKQTSINIGCYCPEGGRCHRYALQELIERAAK